MKKMLSGFLGVLISLPLYAHLLTSEEQARYYGRAQSSEFHHAISHGYEPLTESEYQEAKALFSEKETDRYYGRVRVNWSTLEATGITNKTDSGRQKELLLTTSSASRSQMGKEFALGYVFGDYRVDLEYLFNQTLHFSASPLFTTSNSALVYSSIRTQTFLLNAHYDFKEFLLRPYGTVGAGISLNATNPKLTGVGAGTQSKKKQDLAFGLAVGIRPRLFEKWYLDVFYRYVLLGKAKWAPSAQNDLNPVVLEGRLALKGFGIGVNFLF